MAAANLVDAAPATDDETRAALLDRSGRNFAPIRSPFVQKPPGSASRHGPLSNFVRSRDLRGLRAEILLLGIISSGASDQGWSTTLALPVWARAFGTTRDATGPSATNAVSKILRRLEDRQLIERSRHGRHRQVRITLLREDGSGQPYTRPTGSDDRNRFLQLPHAFWRDGWWEALDLPATAMLLVALHEKAVFRLPTERVPDWYGWSADTAERGFKTLINHGLLTRTDRFEKAPLSPTGLAKVNEYSLMAPFARKSMNSTFKVGARRERRAHTSPDLAAPQ